MVKKGKKLLIIDDEKDICYFEKTYFKKKGFEVLTAYTGADGINIAKSKKPDAAIIDIHLSKGMDGLEVLQKLHAASPNCKCIMVTWDKDKAKEAKELGAVGFITKPTDLKDLEKAVNKAAGE